MPLALVTGASGFIGSTLCSYLLECGWKVRGADCMTDYYDPAIKRQRARDLARLPGDLLLLPTDLLNEPLDALLDGVDTVFHLAGQPGVRASWQSGFPTYLRLNIELTQRLLEACRRVRVDGFVFASSSSVYGSASHFPSVEGDIPRPYSPYGVTKAAAEMLCGLYAQNFGIRTVSLRYFTVYGPEQRPDMAIHRIIGAALTGTEFELYGDGKQVRDFTFVEDVVVATVRAADPTVQPGEIFNVSGGSSVTMNEVIDTVEKILEVPIMVRRSRRQPGDVSRTGGDNSRIAAHLGWQPSIGLDEGLRRQVRWQEGLFKGA